MTYYYNGTLIRTKAIRLNRWSAVTDNYEPGHPIGYGATEIMAIIDLLDLLDEAAS